MSFFIESRKTSILVTGGLGYIGSHIVAALIEDREITNSIVILDNLSTCANWEHVQDTLQAMARRHRKKLFVIFGNVCNKGDLAETFEDRRFVSIGCVIHCAGFKSVEESVSDPGKYFRNNVEGTSELLRALSTYQCSQFIFSSSATVYGQPKRVPVVESDPIMPMNPYGWSKATAEQISSQWYSCDPTRRSVALLRYMNPVGAHASGQLGEQPDGVPDNLVPYIAQVANGQRDHLRVFGTDFETLDGTGVRDYIHITDLAEAHVAAFKKMRPGFHRAVNLGRGIGISVMQMLEAFRKASGKQIPSKEYDRRKGDVAQVYCNADLAFELFDWSAKRGVEDMCKSTWKFINTTNAIKK